MISWVVGMTFILIFFCYLWLRRNIDNLQMERKTARSFPSLIVVISLSLVLVACSSDDTLDTESIHPKENVEEVNDSDAGKSDEDSALDQTDEQIDESTITPVAAEIREMNDCDLVTTALGHFATDYKLDDSHFDEEGFSCFYLPIYETNEEAGEVSGYITIIGAYSTSIFETADELEAHEIYDIYNDNRVESFGGVAYGINEHDGNDVVTQIKTPEFELSLNVTSDRIDLMYGEPSIDVLLKLIDMSE